MSNFNSRRFELAKDSISLRALTSSEGQIGFSILALLPPVDETDHSDNLEYVTLVKQAGDRHPMHSLVWSEVSIGWCPGGEKSGFEPYQVYRPVGQPHTVDAAETLERIHKLADTTDVPAVRNAISLVQQAYNV